eukprot:c29075_g1_i3 orf=339-2252(+)
MAGVPAAAASLYVGDLDLDVTEAQLYELFSQIGLVASIRVCRDSVSRRSLGYAYVNYNASVDALQAIEALNHTLLNGRHIRIMWSHRDPSARKSGVGNIFIKNLNDSIDNKVLHDTFVAFGKILSSKVAMQDGKSRGYGFVHFESEDSANMAIEKVNGMMIEGKKVYVGKFMKKSERAGSGVHLKFTNLYVKNLDQEVTEEILEDKFSEFGKITNLLIMKDENEKSKGFGFINFENSDDAKRAVEAMNGSQLGSKAIFVGRAQKKAEREQILRRQFEEKRLERIQKYQNSNLYVKNLDDAVDDEFLCKHFGVYGTIISAKVMRDDKGLSKGFGFVCFSTPEEAIKAVSESYGCMIQGKPIYVALAQRKEVRRAQLEQQYVQRMAGPAAAMVPAAYPPMYYAPPPGMLPPMSPRQGIMYPLGLRPGWRAVAMPPAGRPGFQPMPMLPMRQLRHRVNGQIHVQSGHPIHGMVPLQQPQSEQVPFKDATRDHQQRQRQPTKYAPNGRTHELPMNSSQPQVLAGQMPVSLAAGSAGPKAVQSNNLADWSSMLANSSPQQQKQMIGERLFPLVQQVQFDLAGKITGMLLEMDNSELLLLVESPDALAAKVEEAMQVLQQHLKASQETLSGGLVSVNGQVAVG